MLRAELRRRLTALMCAGAGALVPVASAWAGGGASGSLQLHIRTGGPTYAEIAVRAALAGSRTHGQAMQPPASRPGASASVVLRIKPATLTPLGRWTMLEPLWQSAATEYGVPWQVLAAIDMIESGNGANLGPSTAGAVGWMQFMPGTWRKYGVASSGDRIADPNMASDAIVSAARYLAASGASTNLPRALFAYNHAWWYVGDVLSLARTYGYVAPGPQSGSSTPAPAFAARAKMNSASLSRFK